MGGQGGVVTSDFRAPEEGIQNQPAWECVRGPVTHAHLGGVPDHRGDQLVAGEETPGQVCRL